MCRRHAPLALVLLAACEPGSGVAHLPPAATPQQLVDAALESPGDGSDILEALAEFQSAESWRNVPAGVVVTPRTIETLLEARENVTVSRADESAP
jgi:hypothetical protein